jgi:hypothetical protein
MKVLVADMNPERGEAIADSFRKCGCEVEAREDPPAEVDVYSCFTLVLVHAGNEDYFADAELLNPTVLTYSGSDPRAEVEGTWLNRAIYSSGISPCEAQEILDWGRRGLVQPFPSLISDKLADDDFLSGCLLWLEALDFERSAGLQGSSAPPELRALMSTLSSDIDRELVHNPIALKMIGDAQSGQLPNEEMCSGANSELSAILGKRLGNG